MKITLALAGTLLFAASSIQLTTLSVASDAAAVAAPIKAEATEERATVCSREVWPNFSPSCLRNVNQATEVRLVTTIRR